MERKNDPTLYLRLRRRKQIQVGLPIHLGDIAQVLSEEEWESQFKGLIIHHPEEAEGNMILIDMMEIVRKVKSICPNCNIEYYGEPHVLVEVVRPAAKPSIVFIIIVWLLLFIGSGLAIMNFHEDVSMMQVHRRIHYLVTGKDNPHPYILQVAYSVGIGVGMMTFFNHIFKKKFNEEPSPLEVEMYLYQENMNHCMVADEYRKKHERSDSS